MNTRENMINLFRDAYRLSRLHSAIAKAYDDRYPCPQGGYSSGYISGGFKDHWPDEVKNEMRGLAQDITDTLNKAWGTRPKGMHKSTVRHIRDDIRTNEGMGFYG